MKIKWNIVNRTGEAFESIAHEVRPKISKLEKLLTHFPEDAVHLQIILDTRASDKTHQVALNLRVPSDVLHVSKESRSLVAAFDDSMRTLVRRLKRLKARYRRDYAWKNRRGQAMPEREVSFADDPQIQYEGPQKESDAIAIVLKEDYERLLGFVARQLNEYVLAGTLPKRAIEPLDIVDRVAEHVLRHPRRKPESMDYRTWCSSLAFQQTRDDVRRHVERMSIAVPIDMDNVPGTTPTGEDDLEPEEFALNLLQNQLEPDETTVADTIPDPHVEPPDAQVARDDLLSHLNLVCRDWPKAERLTFQLHFLEGLSIDDVAHTLSCDRSAVQSTVSSLRGRLRTLLSVITDKDRTAPPSEEQSAAYSRHLLDVTRDAVA